MADKPTNKERLKELGQTAVALTDHGNLYAAISFYQTAKKAGIHPIIGCEVYVASRTRFDRGTAVDRKRYHLVLLCENQTGYQNLVKLVSKACLEGFYQKPRVDWELLTQYHEGLIALSGCLAGRFHSCCYRAIMQLPSRLLSTIRQYSERNGIT